MEGEDGREELGTPLLWQWQSAGEEGDGPSDRERSGLTESSGSSYQGRDEAAMLDSGLKTSEASSEVRTMMSSIPSVAYGSDSKVGNDVSTLKASGRSLQDIADEYESHFTLRVPASTVHFRGSVLRVIDTDQDQIIIQQDRDGGDGGDGKGGKKVLVKRLSPATMAQRFLRAGYTLITILFLGFLFVLCFQVLLFLFVALPVDSGYTSNSTTFDALALVSTIFSIPIMLYGMSSLMGEYGMAFDAESHLVLRTGSNLHMHLL